MLKSLYNEYTRNNPRPTISLSRGIISGPGKFGHADKKQKASERINKKAQ